MYPPQKISEFNMIESYIIRPTVFPIEAEKPWRIVENLCVNITHLIELLDVKFDVEDGLVTHRRELFLKRGGQEIGKDVIIHFYIF